MPAKNLLEKAKLTGKLHKWSQKQRSLRAIAPAVCLEGKVLEKSGSLKRVFVIFLNRFFLNSF